MSELNQENKILLFSTRFIEGREDKYLFSEGNYVPLDVKSFEFKNYFLSVESLTKNIIDYFNHINCYKSLEQFKDESGVPLITINDSIQAMRDKICDFISDGQMSLINCISDLANAKDFCSIEIKDKKEFRLIKCSETSETLYEKIIEYKDENINKTVILNTDFGKAVEKRTIDRRFKIYKLKTENNKDYSSYSIYAVWCLSAGSSAKAESWYKALYEELKSQLGQDEFDKVDEILYFLHDGDIDAKKPFDVIHYKESKFSFLDKNKKLSIAIFDHSNSPIAKALRNPNIKEAIKSAEKAMESGGGRAFLNELSDCLARWSNGVDGKTGKEEYKKKTEKEVIEKYEDLDLAYSSERNNIDSASVELIYKDVKKHIDKLIEEEKADY